MNDHVILKGHIIALSHLHLGTGLNIGNFYPTHDHIPARVIRGMLGNYLHEERREYFEKTNIDNDKEPEIFFKPAFFKGQSAVPRLLHWCKGEKNHLLDKGQLSCASEGRNNESKRKSGYFFPKRSIEERRFINGFLADKKTIYTKCPIIKERHTSPAGDEELAPFNIESIMPGVSFMFRCIVPGNLVEKIKIWLKEAGIFYGLGGFRSKGHGTVLFRFDEEKNEPVSDYIHRREKELEGKKVLLVVNSPLIIRNGDEKYSVGFDKELIKAEIVRIIDTHSSVYNSTHNSSCIVYISSFCKTLVRGWTMKDYYHLRTLIPAVEAGSSAVIDLHPRACALLEVFGLGMNNHINGDVYFLGSDNGWI